MGWCNHAGAVLFVGDFDGDSRDDILCHDTGNGNKWVSLATPDGSFEGTTWSVCVDCNHFSIVLSIGDYENLLTVITFS